jgi:hypothetical protein
LNAKCGNARDKNVSTTHLWLRRISTFSSEKGPRGSENPSRDKKLGTVLIFPIDIKSPKTFVSKLTLLRKVILASLRDKCARTVP